MVSLRANPTVAQAVYGAVYETMGRAVNWAVGEAPPHPGLGLYLRGVT